MIYVTSDIHGCYKEYKRLLEVINFSDEDTLYVLGDVLDRGEDPVKILLDMSERFNVVPLMGNHEFLCLNILPKLLQKITKENYDKALTEELLQYYQMWCADGGEVTIEQFKQLPREKQQDLLDYMLGFDICTTVTVNNHEYILTHASVGFDGCDPDLNAVTLEDYLFNRPNFDHQYFTENILVIGHTPTVLIDEEKPGEVYFGNHLIDIDTGCVFDLCLSALCLDTEEVIQVEKDTLEVAKYNYKEKIQY